MRPRSDSLFNGLSEHLGFYKKEFIGLLPVVDLYDFCFASIVACGLTCLDIFGDEGRLHPLRNVRFSNSKTNFGLENKKPLTKLLVPECQNFYFKYFQTFSTRRRSQFVIKKACNNAMKASVVMVAYQKSENLFRIFQNVINLALSGYLA